MPGAWGEQQEALGEGAGIRGQVGVRGPDQGGPDQGDLTRGAWTWGEGGRSPCKLEQRRTSSDFRLLPGGWAGRPVRRLLALHQAGGRQSQTRDIIRSSDI